MDIDLVVESPSSESSSAFSSPKQDRNDLGDGVEVVEFGDLMEEGGVEATSQMEIDISAPPEEQCEHFSESLADSGVKARYTAKYKALAIWSARRHGPALGGPPSSARSTKRRKIEVPECDTCKTPLHRPFVCLTYNFAGCWKGGHAILHLHDENHGFLIDLGSGGIFCASCDDFIHNVQFEALHKEVTLKEEEKNSKFQESKSKKTRDPYSAWKPTPQEVALLKGSRPVPCHGRRGLWNLGQTCYLNVILQLLFHNPLVRNHFLSDKHNHNTCKNPDCLCCEMDKLFIELYSENGLPIGPVALLHSLWKSSPELAGNQQQDAHEVFISVLNQIHKFSKGSTTISCVCVVHSTFAGQLQSEVQCGKCGNVTSVVDPMLDISLELRGKNGAKDDSQNTLAGCLRRFTQTEKLASKSYACGKCASSSHEATKRLSIKRLPPVLCFQFKRYEHGSTAQKIHSSVRFPAVLNMAPYTSLAAGLKADPLRLGPTGIYDYDLIGVVNHEGQMNTGHYTNYSRLQDDWYRFDDDKVYPSTLAECLASKAYMCVYVKRHLDYKHYGTPSYIVTQQQAAEKERQDKESAKMRELASLAGVEI